MPRLRPTPSRPLSGDGAEAGGWGDAEAPPLRAPPTRLPAASRLPRPRGEGGCRSGRGGQVTLPASQDGDGGGAQEAKAASGLLR